MDIYYNYLDGGVKGKRWITWNNITVMKLRKLNKQKILNKREKNLGCKEIWTHVLYDNREVVNE